MWMRLDTEITTHRDKFVQNDVAAHGADIDVCYATAALPAPQLPAHIEDMDSESMPPPVLRRHPLPFDDTQKTSEASGDKGVLAWTSSFVQGLHLLKSLHALLSSSCMLAHLWLCIAYPCTNVQAYHECVKMSFLLEGPLGFSSGRVTGQRVAKQGTVNKKLQRRCVRSVESVGHRSRIRGCSAA